MSLARATEAGLVVSGSYFFRGDSLAIQTQIVDLTRGDRVLPVELVTVPASEQGQGLEQVLERVMVSLASRLDERLADIAHLQDLPMSYSAYREYAAGIERYLVTEYQTALEHFYRAVELDSVSGAALLMVALTEWNANYDLAKSDSVLRIVERMKDQLSPYDMAWYDFLDAWLRGDLEGALRASRVFSHAGMQGAAALDALRLNRLDEAYAHVLEWRERPLIGSVRGWNFLTLVHHYRGEHERELRVAREGIELTGSHNETVRAEMRALAALGRVPELRQRLEEARQASPASGSFLSMARELRAHGHADAAAEVGQLAVEWYRDAVADSATTGRRVRLAQSLNLIGEFEEARTLFEQLATDRPDMMDPMAYLGIDAARRGDEAAAEAWIERLGNREAPYQRGANTLRQGWIAAQLGQCERAVRFFLQARREGAGVYGWNPRHLEPFENIRDCETFRRFMEPQG